MNLKLIIVLSAVVNFSFCGVVQNKRPKRTLQYFFEGLLSALSEKHRSHSVEDTDFLPFGFSKHKFIGLTSSQPKTSKPLVQLPIPTEETIAPTKAASNSIIIGPMKVLLPLLGKTTSVAAPTTISIPSNETTTLSTTSTTSRLTTTESTSSTTSRSTITESTTSTASSSTSKTLISTTPLAETSLSTASADDTTSLTSTITAASSLSTASVTTIDPIPCDDTTANPPTTIETTTPMSNEIQSKADTNVSPSNTVGIQKLPLRAALLNSGRHTQFFGNPLIIQPHNSYLPSYYREDDYNDNNVDPNPHSTSHLAAYRGPTYLPPISSQLIVLPMAVPFQLPTAAAPSSTVDERNPRHSRIKMHDNDYNHYINHGTGQVQVPVVHLHQAHVQYFGHKPIDQ